MGYDAGAQAIGELIGEMIGSGIAAHHQRKMSAQNHRWQECAEGWRRAAIRLAAATGELGARLGCMEAALAQIDPCHPALSGEHRQALRKIGLAAARYDGSTDWFPGALLAGEVAPLPSRAPNAPPGPLEVIAELQASQRKLRARCDSQAALIAQLKASETRLQTQHISHQASLRESAQVLDRTHAGIAAALDKLMCEIVDLTAHRAVLRNELSSLSSGRHAFLADAGIREAVAKAARRFYVQHEAGMAAKDFWLALEHVALSDWYFRSMQSALCAFIDKRIRRGEDPHTVRSEEEAIWKECRNRIEAQVAALEASENAAGTKQGENPAGVFARRARIEAREAANYLRRALTTMSSSATPWSGA